MRVRGLRRLIWYGAMAISLAACAASLPRNPVPLGMESDAAVVGMGGETIRFWGDVPPPNSTPWPRRSGHRSAPPRRMLPKEGGRPVVSFLAISGGGADGAFGAGVLAGWTQRAIARNSTGDGRQHRRVDRAVRLPWTALRRCAEEGLHRVNHKRHCHRAPRERTAWRRVACEQCAPRRVVAFYVNDGFLKEVAAEH